MTDTDKLREIVQRMVDTRTCRVCAETKPIIEFKKNPTGKNGYERKCRICDNEQERIRRLNNIEKYRAKAKLRKHVPHIKKRRDERLNANKKKHPLREKAKSLLREAIRKGEVIKPTKCNICHKERPLDGHHEDYNNPLIAIWMCKPCHSKYHCGVTGRANEIRKAVKHLYKQLLKETRR